MARCLPHRLREDRGFTLIELMVVILIVGILSAIAIPTFMNQRAKAQDTDAKSAVRVARVTLETFHTDRQTYDTDAATIVDMEPGLTEARGLTVSGTAKTFTVSVESKSSSGGGGTFTITLDAAGDVTRTCTNPGKGGCRDTPDSSGNLW